MATLIHFFSLSCGVDKLNDFEEMLDKMCFNGNKGNRTFFYLTSKVFSVDQPDNTQIDDCANFVETGL